MNSREVVLNNIRILTEDTLEVNGVEFDLHHEMVLRRVGYDLAERAVRFTFVEATKRCSLIITGGQVERLYMDWPGRGEGELEPWLSETVLMFCWSPAGHADQFEMIAKPTSVSRDYDLVLVTDSGLRCAVNIGCLHADVHLISAVSLRR